jgi:hypothetical protein
MVGIIDTNLIGRRRCHMEIIRSQEQLVSDERRSAAQRGSRIRSIFVYGWKFEDRSHIHEIEIAFGLRNPKSIENELIICNGWANQNAE